MGSLQDAINSNLDKSDDELAIVGLDFILPQARTLKELDQLFSKGVDCVAYPSKKRRKLMEPFFEQGKEYTYIPGAYIDDIDQFDYNFFKITKLDAELMDPYQRLFLQSGWHALEDAGLTKEKLKEAGIAICDFLKKCKVSFS